MSYNVSEIVSGLMNDFRGCRVVRGIKGGGKRYIQQHPQVELLVLFLVEGRSMTKAFA